jgi:hypothetical protein
MIHIKRNPLLAGVLALLCVSASLYAGDTLTTWQYSTVITLNTSPTGANTSTTQYNFPVLIRLTSLNAAGLFATAQSNGGDLRFTRTGVGDTSQLPYELNKYNQAAQTAIIWVKVDSLQGNKANQTINMYWGKSSAVTTSDSANVFMPSNGFAAVLHLNKRSTGNTLYDATGQGNNGTCSNTVTDTTGIFDSAVAMHCYGTSSSYIAGDSITIAGLLGSPSQVTLSAWVRVDSIDQANTSANGHLACLMSMGDYASLNDAGASGTGNDSLTAAWFGSGTQWNNYGWPSPSQTGTSLNGFSNSSGDAAWHQGWKHVAEVINPTAGYANVYINGDSVRTLPAANALAWTGGNSGKRTVIGKHGGGHAGLKFGGSICESRFESVPRASDWIRLCYQNQQPNDSLTSLNAQIAGVPALSSPANGAVNQPVSLSLVWSAVSGSTTYQVQVSTAANFANTIVNQSLSGTSQAISGLAVATVYYWRANATGTHGTSSWSGVWSFTTVVPAPGQPTLSSPGNGTQNVPLNVNLTWGTVSTATSYQVQVATTTSFGTTVFAQSGLATTLVAASGLANAVTYYWHAGAANGGGNGAWSSTWSFTAVPVTPGIPALSSPVNGATGVSTKLTLSWTSASPAAASYIVQVTTSSTFATTFLSQTVTGTSLAVSGLAGTTTYYWDVTGVNGSVQGTSSVPWDFTTGIVAVLPSAPLMSLKTDFMVKSDAIEYSVAARGEVAITFTDLLGRTALAVSRTMAPGNYSMLLRDCALASGRYIVQFKAAGIEKQAVVLIDR